MGAIWETGMNPEQLLVINHEGGPARVLAQAGSGKTRALVHRTARLIEVCGVPGDRIFEATFSRKAADEMDARLRHIGIGSAAVQTWHAFCYRMLREDQTREGRWTLDEKDRAKIFVKKAMGHEHENWQGGDLTKVRGFIGQCKANLAEPGSDFARALAQKMFGSQFSRAIRVFSISQSLIEDAQLLTFDDMLVFAHRHMQDETHRRAWAGRFDYVMIDEAQDNNLAQCALQEQLARDHRNIMVVGDLAQAIYSFRGSSPEHLARFEELWAGAKTISMCRNYRSGSEIIRVANDVIRPGKFRQPEDMIASREPAAPGKVEVVPADTLEDEANEFVSFVRAHQESGRKLSDLVVLFRLNAQSRSLEEAMLKARIPYVIIGGTNFYERKEVKDLLAYLRVAGRDVEGDAVKRCINAPFRYLGAKFVERVMAVAANNPKMPWDGIVEAAAYEAGIQRRQIDSAMQWVAIVQNVRAMMSGERSEDKKPASAYEVLDAVVKATNYIAWLEKEEGEESIESSHAANVRELLRVSQQFPQVGDLLDYIEKTVKESQRQKRTRSENVVTLMSIHRSKGLEWPVVWVVGCNDTILPHAKGDLEEERRLMYVAVTRARDHLICSHVAEMAMRTGLKTVLASPFLESFPMPVPFAEVEEPGQLEIGMDLGIGEDATAIATFTPDGPPVVEVLERNPGSALAWLTEGPARVAQFVKLEGAGKCAACGASLAACSCTRIVEAAPEAVTP